VIQQALIEAIHQAAVAAADDLGLQPDAIPEPELSRPKQKEHGDWATNLALVLARPSEKSPRAVAEAIVAHMDSPGLIERVEVAGPGFINLFLGHGWLHDVLSQALREGPEFGRGERGRGRVQVEYVSANPTGPLHVGTARNAALGDSVGNLLDAAGHDVEREYYFNDAGRQLELYGESVEARYLEHFGIAAEIPEGGYHGAQVTDVAEEVAREVGDSLLHIDTEERKRRMLELAVATTMDGIRKTLERFNVRMDTWASQAAMYDTGAIDRAVEQLRQKDYAYDAEGAVFFRSTAFGDEKDRVLIRSNGQPTYFAADCAYVLDKAGRGFDRMIYVWGADHHGTVKRLMGAAEALGVDPGRIHILIYQFVNLSRGGDPVRMSRRSGDYVTLDELLDEVGTDAARYTLVARSADSTIDFDIEVVTRQTMDNPVYYVQYAHARISSVLRLADERGVDRGRWEDARFDVLVEEAELDLLRKLAEFPEMVSLAAEALAPHRITHFAEEVAAAVHRFYTECRVITDDHDLTVARLWLILAARQVVSASLGLIGVSAPESMERIDGTA
jgi:arginyl-tRNA synthetase